MSIMRAGYIRLISGGLAVCSIISVIPSAHSENVRPAQPDATMTAEQRNCDLVAERARAQVRNLTPVNPVSVLNPILLLNDLNRRKQEEENQPRLLEQIEQQRQSCYRETETRAALRVQEALEQKQDSARGYKLISFETFALDAKAMAANQTKISVKGTYVPDSNMEWFFATQSDAIMVAVHGYNSENIARIPLLTEDATRDFRQFLLKCKAAPTSAQQGCPAVISGHVSQCTLSNALGASRSVPCIVVESGRDLNRVIRF